MSFGQNLQFLRKMHGEMTQEELVKYKAVLEFDGGLAPDHIQMGNEHRFS